MTLEEVQTKFVGHLAVSLTAVEYAVHVEKVSPEINPTYWPYMVLVNDMFIGSILFDRPEKEIAQRIRSLARDMGIIIPRGIID